jgi:poly(A) polymerase
MSKISGDWLTNPATQHVAAVISGAGYQIYFVGGCVRNALLNTSVSDIDMATNALPNIVIELCTKAGLKAIPTGIDHGTVTIISNDIPHEITTFRTDIATDGRHADVAFSDNITDDALRRDFTMNALYADQTGTISDPVNGLPDLLTRRVKFVGDPHERINEDYLRILRFFRFHAWYGDPSAGLDADGLAACAEGLAGVPNLSRERVGAEMIKLLSATNPAPAVASMAQAGVLQIVMEGADPKALAPLEHFENGRAPDWRRRAAVLGGNSLREAWRLSKKDAFHMAELRNALGSAASVAELAYRHGANLALNASLARAAIFETPPATSLDQDIERGVAATFPVKASDLPNLNGPELGNKLRNLEASWIKSNFTMSKDDLLAL